MTAPEALAFLAKERRTVLLGGAAIILHGMNRSTKDFDIWMDPHPDANTWAAPIGHLLEQDPKEWRISDSEHLSEVFERVLAFAAAVKALASTFNLPFVKRSRIARRRFSRAIRIPFGPDRLREIQRKTT